MFLLNSHISEKLQKPREAEAYLLIIKVLRQLYFNVLFVLMLSTRDCLPLFHSLSFPLLSKPSLVIMHWLFFFFFPLFLVNRILARSFYLVVGYNWFWYALMLCNLWDRKSRNPEGLELVGANNMKLNNHDIEVQSQSKNLQRVIFK